MTKRDITVCIDAYPDTEVFRIRAADDILDSYRRPRDRVYDPFGDDFDARKSFIDST